MPTPAKQNIPKTKKELESVFPLDYFMDDEQFQMLTQRSTVLKNTMDCLFLVHSNPLTRDDAAWCPGRIVSYDKLERLLLIELSDKQRFWKPMSQVRQKSQSLQSFQKKWDAAAVLRDRFEYEVTLQLCITLLTPKVRDLVPEFPVEKIEEIFERSRQEAGMNLPIELGREGTSKSEVVNDTDLLFDICQDLRNDYLNSQIRAALIWKRHFTHFLKKMGYLQKVAFSSYDSVPRYVFNTENNDVSFTSITFRQSQDLEQKLNFLDVSAQRCLADIRENCAEIFGPVILNTFLETIEMSNLQGKDLDSFELILDQYDGHVSIAFTAFLETMEFFQDDFRESFRNKIPALLDGLFQNLLKAHGIREPGSLASKMALTLTERAKRASATPSLKKTSGTIQQDFVTMGKFVSVMAKSFLLPVVRNKIMETYRLFESNQIRVRLTCLLLKDGQLLQHSDLEFSVTGHYDIVLDHDLAEEKGRLQNSLMGWLNIVDCILPHGVIESTPQDYRFLETLFLDTITDGIESNMVLLQEIRTKIVTLIEKGTKPLPRAVSVEDYLLACQSQLNDLETLHRQASRKMKWMRRGIFEVELDTLSASIQQLVSAARLHVQRLSVTFLNERVQLLTEKYDAFFRLPEPVTFEQTKNSAIVLQDMKAALPALHKQIEQNLKMKTFMDNQRWIQEDNDTMKLFESCVTIQKLEAFIDLRSQQVAAAFEKLRLNIGREIEMFMTLWNNVETAMSKLFAQPNRGNNAQSPIKDSSDSSQKSKDRRSSDLISMDSFSEEYIVSSLNYIIRHISNAADIANVISKKIDVLENVPRTEEMKKIWSYMKLRSVLVQALMKARQRLREWRSKAVVLLDLEEIGRESKVFLQVMTDTDLVDCSLVKNSRNDLQTFLKCELPLIKVLKTPIFQVCSR